MSYEPLTDLYGRKLYGDHVHQDFFPFRWIPAPILIWLLHFVVPTMLTIVFVLAYGGMLIATMTLMKPRDYPPPAFWLEDLWRAFKLRKRTRSRQAGR